MNKHFDNNGKYARKTKRAEVATNELSALTVNQALTQGIRPLIPYMSRGQTAQALRCNHES